MNKIIKVCLIIVSTMSLIRCTSTPVQDYDDVTGLTIYDGVSSNQVYLKWHNISAALSYNLICSTNTNQADLLVTNVSDTSFLHQGLVPGTSYFYKIQANFPETNSVSIWHRAVTAPVLSPALSGGALITHDSIIYSYDPTIHSKPTNELLVITLNMHTYQESEQDAKFDLIVKTIALLDADLIAFQENAQRNTSTVVTNIGAVNIKDDNMALIIQQRLKTYYGLDYFFAWDWAHYGWTVWEEGIAVMSKTPLSGITSTYVSSSASTSSLTSRKAIIAETYIPQLDQNINFVSTHLHWKTSVSDPEPKSQVNNVKALVEAKHSASDLSIVCGDYNSQATETDVRWGEAYFTMITNDLYMDTFLEYNTTATNMPENAVFDTVKGDYPGRIDYIFMRTNSQYNIRSSQIIFTPAILGTVSDHYGVVTRIQKN